MKINLLLNNITFGNVQKQYYLGSNLIIEDYDESGNIIKRHEKDSLGRTIDTKSFDTNGNLIDHLHKDYYQKSTETGYFETFKNATQEYIRHGYTKIENGLKHSFDDFKSKSNPNKSYVNEFIHDLKGNLIRIISNGKITEIKK